MYLCADLQSSIGCSCSHRATTSELSSGCASVENNGPMHVLVGTCCTSARGRREREREKQGERIRMTCHDINKNEKEKWAKKARSFLPSVLLDLLNTRPNTCGSSRPMVDRYRVSFVSLVDCFVTARAGRILVQLMRRLQPPSEELRANGGW